MTYADLLSKHFMLIHHEFRLSDGPVLSQLLNDKVCMYEEMMTNTVNVESSLLSSIYYM